MSELPDFIIVGAMRSGTSSLARWLRDHPRVFMPDRKELHFFDTAPIDAPLEDYRHLFAGAAAGQVIGEATPSYMFLPEARERMAAAVPEATLVVLLRDPVQRAYSHYWHERERGEETLSFRDALDRESDRLTQGHRHRVAFSYQARGHYIGQLRSLADLVGRDRLHVEFFEDLQAEPQQTFGRVCGAIGVDVVDVPRVGTQVNAFTSLRSRRLHAWAATRGTLVQKIVGRLNGRPSGYPPLDPTIHDQLREVFSPDDTALAEWLGRPIPWAEH